MMISCRLGQSSAGALRSAARILCSFVCVDGRSGRALLRGVRLQPVEKGNSRLCLGGSGKQRARVRLHHLEPMVNIARVVGVRLCGDADTGTQERRATFGAGFLETIGVIAKALAETAVEAVRRAGPVAVMPISA